MVTLAKVLLWGKMIGAVAWDESRGHAVFEFDDSFARHGLDIAPITMPIDQILSGKRIFSFSELSRKTFSGLPGLLADSLPDTYGNALISKWLSSSGRTAESINPVERLCYTGKRGMGALEYEPVIKPFRDESESIEISELVALANEALSQKEHLNANITAEQNKGLLEIIRVGTSAGGARAKAIIAYNEKTGDVRSGQIDGLDGYEYMIIKFDGVANKHLGDPKGYGRIEYAYYLMATACGITMSPSKLLTEGKRAHFITKRFDRDGAKKLHMQTLCGIAHFDYNDSAAYAYEQAFQVMRKLRLPYSSAEELFKRMVFNVIARNQDDHTKNISFLMDEYGKWSLSPAYDVTYAYDPQNIWMKSHQMSINRKRDNIELSDVLEVAKQMNIKKPIAIIEQVIEAVSSWPRFAKDAGVDKDQIRAIENAFVAL